MPSGGGCARRTGAGLSEPGADRRSPPDTFFRREEEKQPLGEEGCRIFKQTDPRPSRFCCLKTLLFSMTRGAWGECRHGVAPTRGLVREGHVTDNGWASGAWLGQGRLKKNRRASVLLLTRCSGKKSIRHTLTALPLLLALEVISLGAYQRQRLRHLALWPPAYHEARCLTTEIKHLSGRSNASVQNGICKTKVYTRQQQNLLCHSVRQQS
ncbi:uncharacterized protein ACIQIH_011712 isoform 2-T2 [Cyanocitta cristata]